MAKKNKNLIKENESPNVNPSDFIVDDNIDDKYTKNLFQKTQAGVKKKNKWFTCSGILSIIFGIICVVTMIVLGFYFLSSADRLKDLALNGDLDYDKTKNMLITACVIIPIAGIISILLGIRICIFAKYSKEKLQSKAVSVILYAIAQFFVGGIIFCLLTIVAYFMGISGDYGAIYYNRIDKGDLTEKQLHNAKLYHQNELINDEEYEDLKRDILKDKNIYF